MYWKEHMKVLRDFLKGSEKQIFHLNRVNAGLDMERLIFWATLYMGIIWVHKLNRLGTFCRPNVPKQRNSVVVFWAWSIFIGVTFRIVRR